MGAAPFDLLGHTLGAGPSPGLGNGSITQNAPAAQIQANVGNEMSLFRFLAITAVTTKNGDDVGPGHGRVDMVSFCGH